MPPAKQAETEANAVSRWGTLKRGAFWGVSALLAPFAAGGVVLVSGVVSASLAALVIALDAGRFAETLGTDGSFYALVDVLAPGVLVLLGTTVLVHWIAGTPLSVRVDSSGIRTVGLLGPKRFRWRDVSRAFVTVPDGQPGKSVLHLWTRWRDMDLPVWRVLGLGSSSDRLREFDALCSAVDEGLRPQGLQVIRGLPTTSVTHVGAAMRYLLLWPHRRILSHRALRGNSDGAPPADHRLPLPSIALAWAFRPAPVAAILTLVGLLFAARWLTDSDVLLTYLAGLGVLSALVLPLWNEVKRRWLVLSSAGALRPEMLVGHHRLSTLPKKLIPASGCVLDLDRDRIVRPDGRSFSCDDIIEVEYGPRHPHGGSRRLDGPWHLAVTTATEGPDKPFEIYSNASADIVKHGDLDSGYAVFNWIAARELALRSKCRLVLANGRVPAGSVGEPLGARIERELANYDTSDLRREMAERGESSAIHIRSSAERFEAWSPLSRLPEQCATPPIWRIVLALGALVSIGVGFPGGGLIAGYLAATSIHDLLTHVHFRAPGFAMDADGVWVRGVCIPWHELEESTLMPIAPGPILFAGSSSVTVAGHLGQTYNERVILGCAAYEWIREYAPLEAREAAQNPETNVVQEPVHSPISIQVPVSSEETPIPIA